MTTYSAILTNLICSIPLAGLLLAGPSAPAQTTSTVTIPFSFSANGATMPAGRYVLGMDSERIVSFRNVETRAKSMLLVRPEYRLEPQSRGKIVFQRNGGAFYLTQVWLPGSTEHSEMIGHPKPGQIVAKNDASATSTVEIALR